MNPDPFKLIKDRLRLSEYIGKFTDLNSGSGNKWRGPCPIHDGSNKNALSVDDDRGLWKCFTNPDCGGGSIIDFWMRHNSSTDMNEALESLAQEARITLPSRTGRSMGAGRVIEALNHTGGFLCDVLNDSKDSDVAEVLEYLVEERSVSSEIIQDWNIGFLPNGDDWVDAVREDSHDLDALIAGGFLRKDERSDRLWSPYSGRITFPIWNRNGDTVGFGGRSVDPEARSKYVNPTDTPAYHKSRVLYGMDLLSKKPRRVIVIEGYLDSIAVNEVSDDDTIALATCGTSLTTGQLELIEDVNEIIFMFDGDPAGSRAMSSLFWTVNKLEDKAKAILLKDGQDPWDMFVSRKEELIRLLSTEGDSLLDMAVTARHELSETSSDFDRWVAHAYATLDRNTFKERILDRSAKIRDMDKRRYSRTLAESRPKRPDSGTREEVLLDPGMASIIRRCLQESEETRVSLFASLVRWPESVSTAVRTYLPITTETDVDAFQALATDEVISNTNVVDQALAGCIPDADAEVESIYSPLQGIASVMSVSAEDLIDDDEIPETLQRRIWMLSRVRRAAENVEDQVTVLCFLLDLAVDMERWTRAK